MRSTRAIARISVAVCLLTGLATTVFLDRPRAQGGAIDPKLYQSLQWRNIGPDRGGRSIAASGVRGRRLDGYFGAVGGGLWKTVDGGENWKPVTDGQIDSSSVGAVAVSESNPDIVYIGMGESHIRGNIMQGDGIYKSSDAGKTWSNVGFKTPGFTISRIRIHPTNPDVVYVAVFGNVVAPSPERGVYRTRDGGKTWQRVLFRDDKSAGIEVQIDMNNPNVLYASLWEAYRQSWQMSSGGPGTGLFKSTDGGDTWTEFTRAPGLPAQGPLGKIGIAVSRVDSNRAVGAAGARERRALHERRCRRHVEAGERRPQHPPARVLLLARLRRSEAEGHGVDAEREHVPLHRCRQDAAERARAARGLPRPVDRPGRLGARRQRQRRRRHGVVEHRRDLERSGVSDRAAVSPERHQHVPVLRLRWPAGQLHGLRAGQRGYRATSARATSRRAAARAATSTQHPTNQNLFYSGSQGALITRFDKATGHVRDIQPYPASSPANRRRICPSAGSGRSRSCSIRSMRTRSTSRRSTSGRRPTTGRAGRRSART